MQYEEFLDLVRSRIPLALFRMAAPLVLPSVNVADGAQSVIREQVEMGVAVRMAVLDALSRNLPGGGNA